MKYRLELLVEVVVKLIMKTAKEIEEPYDIEFEQMIVATKTTSYYCVKYYENCARIDCQGVQKHHITRID